MNYLYPTGKQIEIIDLVYKFRFINRTQIQKILNHKDPRRINAWLKELVEYKYLGRIYSKKLLENTKPAIYYLSFASIKFIKERKDFELKDVKKFYEDKKASQKFIDHCINLVAFYLQIKELERATTNTYLHLSKTEAQTYEQLRELKPDAYIEMTKRKSKTKMVKIRYFLDILDPHVPRYALRYRIKQYIDFHDNESNWKQLTNDGKFPYILLIFPDTKKLNHIKKYIKEQLEREFFVDDMVFSLTTTKELLEQGFKSQIWETITGK